MTQTRKDAEAIAAALLDRFSAFGDHPPDLLIGAIGGALAATYGRDMRLSDRAADLLASAGCVFGDDWPIIGDDDEGAAIYRVTLELEACGWKTGHHAR